MVELEFFLSGTAVGGKEGGHPSAYPPGIEVHEQRALEFVDPRCQELRGVGFERDHQLDVAVRFARIGFRLVLEHPPERVAARSGRRVVPSVFSEVMQAYAVAGGKVLGEEPEDVEGLVGDAEDRYAAPVRSPVGNVLHFLFQIGRYGREYLGRDLPRAAA